MSRSFRQVVVIALVAGLLVAGAGASVGGVGASSQTTECAYPVSKVDATGTEVVVEAEPDSVVSVSPSAAQTMWEIGAKDKVVGLTKFASYLEGAQTRANVSGAGYTTVVVEKVVAQEPDLVLAPNIVQNETVRKLREAGLTVYRFRAAKSLEDVKEKTLLIGRLTGECEGANARVEEMDASIELIREAVADEPKRSVLYHLGGGYTAGSETFINSLIETAGGTNIAADAGIAGYRQISPETVVEKNPTFIVHPDNPRGSALPSTYNTTTAVREGNVVAVNDNYVNQPAPRTVEALRTMVKAFHPEAYQEAVESQETTSTTTDETTTEPTTQDTTTQTTEDTPSQTTTTSPGVGAAGVAVALLLVTLMRRYR